MNDVLSLSACARRLGVRVDVLGKAVARRWLRGQRTPGGFHRIPWAALRAFVQDRRCWLLVAPERIPDPLLRAYALDARRLLGGGRWWTTSELLRYYCISAPTMDDWRANGWGRGPDWLRYGIYWRLWAVNPPPPPTDRRQGGAALARVGPMARARVTRARVVAAVLAAGGPPVLGSPVPFWKPLGASLQMSADAARAHWRMAMVYGEVPGVAPAAD